jgi:predicted nucleic acid-binding protein
MHEAISNSSTLIHLAAIGRLDLLKKFHDKIIIPPAVWKEVVEEGRSRPGAQEVKKARENGWIDIVTPEDRRLLQLLRSQLNEGEAEAIAPAIERKAKILFLDETEGRAVADIYDLQKSGVIGVLIRAKLQGEISSLKRELTRLRNKAGFWIEEKPYQQVLRSVGEKPESNV